MPYYSASAGIQVSTDGVTYYPLTDHNRAPLDFSYDNLEKMNRMADGTMRKFVVARKQKITSSWKELPSGTIDSGNPNSGISNLTVDGYAGGAWIKSFYEKNLFNPIYIKVAHSQQNYAQSNSFTPSAASASYQVFRVFMTGFSYSVSKRYTLTDLVDITIDFTEI